MGQALSRQLHAHVGGLLTAELTCFCSRISIYCVQPRCTSSRSSVSLDKRPAHLLSRRLRRPAPFRGALDAEFSDRPHLSGAGGPYQGWPGRRRTWHQRPRHPGIGHDFCSWPMHSSRCPSPSSCWAASRFCSHYTPLHPYPQCHRSLPSRRGRLQPLDPLLRRSRPQLQVHPQHRVAEWQEGPLVL